MKKGERVGGEVREMGRGRPCRACKPLQRLAFPLGAKKTDCVVGGGMTLALLRDSVTPSSL